MVFAVGGSMNGYPLRLAEERLRRVEQTLINLIAETGDLDGPAEPIWARNQLLGALGLVQDVQGMLAEDGDLTKGL
jgi:hypothetical protein